MKKLPLPLLFAVSLLCVPVAFAAPLYERVITPYTGSGPGPTFISIPSEVLQKSSLESLRIMNGNVVVASKTSPASSGALPGAIRRIDICSIDAAGGGETVNLHDGSDATAVRPDPLKNPSICSLEIFFNGFVGVDRVSLMTKDHIKSLTVLGTVDSPNAANMGTNKNSNEIGFSRFGTDLLMMNFTYDIVPTLSEIIVSGAQPARILFIQEPDTSYTLVYGDGNPPPLPVIPSSLFASKDTSFSLLGKEQVIAGDDDGDSIANVRDNCRSVKNPDQKDTDHDGLGDACDNAQDIPNLLQNDKDLDGVGDATDNCRTMFNPDQRDSDINGVGDVCDDEDGDGVVNSKDNCAGIANADQKDADGDGAGDACQLDRDSDGAPDTVDNCRSLPNAKQEDADQDDIGDICDNCPSTKNQNQRDENGNGIGEACEASIIDVDSDGIVNADDNCSGFANPDQIDRDNDGVGDTCDNCPTIQNHDQRDSDKNKQGDACTDSDSDGLLPPLDNCPTVANVDQSDKNNNGIGDVCEDDDNDGVINATDNCRYKSNHNQQDLDADDVGDTCDETDNRLSEQHPWVLWIGTSFLVLVLIGISVRMVMKIRKEQGANV
jgi:hypothetical protein